MGAATGSHSSTKVKVNKPSRIGAGYRTTLTKWDFKNLGLY
jgi:hypothetical protein